MTSLRTRVKSIVKWWSARCREKRLEQAYPALRVINRKIMEAKRGHREVMSLYRQKQEFMAAALRGEVRS